MRAAAGGRHRRQHVRGLIALTLLLPQTLAGCYTTRPYVGTQPQPGEEVVVTISDQGRVELNDRLGVQPYAVRGVLAEADAQAITVRVATIRPLNGGTVSWAGEAVRFSRQAVAQVEERRLSRTRSFLFAAGSAVAVALLIGGLGSAVGGGESGTRAPGEGGPGSN